MIININLPGEKEDLISGIKSLHATAPAPSKKKKVIEEEAEPVLLSSLKPKKEKKKKKKKKVSDDLEFMASGHLAKIDEMDEIIASEESGEIPEDNLIDLDEIFYEQEDEDDDDKIVDEQRRSYKKRKSDENEFKKEFAEEVTLLYGLLDDVTKFGKELDKKYKATEGSKARGASKNINELISNIISTKTSRLQIIKEITSVKKTIADLKIKVDAKSAKSDAGEGSPEYLANHYIQNILKMGRNNFIKQVGGSRQEEQDDVIDDAVASIQSQKDGYSDFEEEGYMDEIENRLSSAENPFRSMNGSKYIEYENRGVKICIKRCIDTNEWEFVAIDRDNQEVYDYPLPNRRDVGKVKFSDDSTYATDERGRSYKVIEYFLPTDEEDED